MECFLSHESTWRQCNLNAFALVSQVFLLTKNRFLYTVIQLGVEETRCYEEILMKKNETHTKKEVNSSAPAPPVRKSPAKELKVKFEAYGEEMIEKVVKLSGNSGRVYLPPDWIDHRVKIIRID